jgi:hypothetical protein
MNKDDGRKAKGADNEREAIPDAQSLHTPCASRVPLLGEISEASLLMLLDVLPDALVMVDQTGCIAMYCAGE